MKVALHVAQYPGEPLTMTSLGVGYLYSYLQQNFKGCDLHLKIVSDVDETISFRPDVIGVGAVSQVIGEAKRFAQACKAELGCITILGGYHITALPELLPDEFDFGVVGEGEETLLELLTALENGNPSLDILENISGIVFRTGNQIRVSAPRSFITSLDSLPQPYRLSGMEKDAPVFTSRGCPYKCTFCASHCFWGDKYRLRSADSVIREIQSLVEKSKVKEIAILDDLWMANKERFRQIANKLIELKIPEKVTFRGFCRSNMVDDADIVLLKRLNYRFIRFGAETGSDRLLSKLKGKGITIGHHQRLIDMCAKHSIPCAGSFMFGSPDETEEDIEETMGFLRKNREKLFINGFYLFNPIPGTELWRRLEADGVVDANVRFDKFQLDMNRSSFNWDDLYYWNEKNVPLVRFKEYMMQIRSEFMCSSKKVQTRNSGVRERTFKMCRRIVWKIQSACSSKYSLSLLLLGMPLE